MNKTSFDEVRGDFNKMNKRFDVNDVKLESKFNEIKGNINNIEEQNIKFEDNINKHFDEKFNKHCDEFIVSQKQLLRK